MSQGLMRSPGLGPPGWSRCVTWDQAPSGGCHMTKGLFSCQNTRERKDFSKSKREAFPWSSGAHEWDLGRTHVSPGAELMDPALGHGASHPPQSPSGLSPSGVLVNESQDHKERCRGPPSSQAGPRVTERLSGRRWVSGTALPCTLEKTEQTWGWGALLGFTELTSHCLEGERLMRPQRGCRSPGAQSAGRSCV